jgi:hypothetical protein
LAFASKNKFSPFQAGLFLNMCICGTLFRDLEVTKKQKPEQQQQQQQPGIVGGGPNATY